MAAALITNKKISTTLPKARALRKYIEPLLTRGKQDTMHNRRTVFSYLGAKEVVKELFETVGPKIADRPGGYTRILKIGARQGDAAEVCIIELVDFNEFTSDKALKTKTRRSRRAKGKKKAADAENSTQAAASTEESAE
jgi:large subunit ribosomal protein L17